MLSLALACLPFAAAADDAKAHVPHVVFVAGDEEYRSEEVLPFLARILREQHGWRTTVCYPLAPDGTIKPDQLTNIAGLEALKTADLMVMFTRFRQLPDEQMKLILDYANSGKPMLGFRTASHAFSYKSGPYQKWNDDFGRTIFGQKWITHHGHEKGEFLTAVTPLAAKGESPILRGVTPFQVASWLYHVEGGGDKLHGDCQTLLSGRALVSGHQKSGKSDRFPLTQPVAWTKTYAGTAGKPARVFFTTLGHPHDFKSETLRKVVVNAAFWCVGREKDIPDDGCKADVPGGKFDLSAPGVGSHKKNQKPPR